LDIETEEKRNKRLQFGEMIPDFEQEPQERQFIILDSETKDTGETDFAELALDQ
jgi:hypothetical protein